MQLLLPDKAKADNKAAAALAPAVVVPAIMTSPLRDSTNGNSPVSAAVNGNGSLSARFDSSSTRSSPISTPVSEIETPTLAPVEVVASVETVASVDVEGEDAEEGEISFEEAVKRREARELEQATLMCSLENKDACVSKSSFLIQCFFLIFFLLTMLLLPHLQCARVDKDFGTLPVLSTRSSTISY